jgi:hypothetical protein
MACAASVVFLDPNTRSLSISLPVIRYNYLTSLHRKAAAIYIAQGQSAYIHSFRHACMLLPFVRNTCLLISSPLYSLSTHSKTD